MSTNTKLAEALRLAREWFRHEEAGEGPQVHDVIEAADEALAAHDAEQAQGSDSISDAFKAGMAAMEYAIWEGKEPCPCRKQAAQAVPAGFKWVPVEPTEDMLFAAELSKPRGYRDLWAAMLASAPAAPAPEAQAARAAMKGTQ